jgi:hypothetical protein
MNIQAINVCVSPFILATTTSLVDPRQNWRKFQATTSRAEEEVEKKKGGKKRFRVWADVKDVLRCKRGTTHKAACIYLPPSGGNTCRDIHPARRAQTRQGAIDIAEPMSVGRERRSPDAVVENGGEARLLLTAKYLMLNAIAARCSPV